jgi:hypothetical protein
VFTNDNEIKIEGKNEGERYEEIVRTKVKLQTHGGNSPTWGIFCVNDKSPFDVKVPHVIHCILHYSKPIGHEILKQRRRLRKSLISYFNNNGIINIKKKWV